MFLEEKIKEKDNLSVICQYEQIKQIKTNKNKQKQTKTNKNIKNKWNKINILEEFKKNTCETRSRIWCWTTPIMFVQISKKSYLFLKKKIIWYKLKE